MRILASVILAAVGVLVVTWTASVVFTLPDMRESVESKPRGLRWLNWIGYSLLYVIIPPLPVALALGHLRWGRHLLRSIGFDSEGESEASELVSMKGLPKWWWDRMFRSKELRAVYAALDELETRFANPTYELVRAAAERRIRTQPGAFQSLVRSGTTPRTVSLTMVSNIAGDLLESGQYHLWRGALNPVGPGPRLLELYDATLDEAVQSGLVAADWAKEQKAGLRRRIEGVG